MNIQQDYKLCSSSPHTRPQTLTRRFLLSKYHAAARYACVILFTPIRTVRPSFNRFSRKFQIRNSINRGTVAPNFTTIGAHMRKICIEIHVGPVSKLWLLLSRFSRYSPCWTSLSLNLIYRILPKSVQKYTKFGWNYIEVLRKWD